MGVKVEIKRVAYESESIPGHYVEAKPGTSVLDGWSKVVEVAMVNPAGHQMSPASAVRFGEAIAELGRSLGA